MRSYYETQLIKNMLHHQEYLPYVFENVEIAFLEKGSLQRAVFYAIAKLWKDRKTININTIDVHSHVGSHIDDRQFRSYLNDIDSEEPELTLDESIDFITNQYIKEKLVEYRDEFNKQLSSKVIDYGNIITLCENISELINIQSRSGSSRDNNIFSSENYLDFINPFLKDRFVIHKKNLTFIAGAAKNMKTSLATFMENDLLENGYKILHFPVDSNYRETMINLISMRRKINRELILLSRPTKDDPFGKLTEDEYKAVMEEDKNIKERFINTGQLVIDDDSKSLPEINLKIRTVKPDLVIIDLVNSIVLPNIERGENTEAFETPIIMNRLKQLAKQMDCAILGLVWLNTTRRRPTISDLYGSKAAEKWASKVWLVYYAYAYEMYPGFKDIFEIIDGASRFGENKIYPAKVMPHYCRFDFSDHDDGIKKTYTNLTKLPGHLVWKGKGNG